VKFEPTISKIAFDESAARFDRGAPQFNCGTTPVIGFGG
jgi:hypothetical protein